ncbi:MAG: HlyD family type I secretion periplasmic adaptor subunit [Pseudomonadota bacterium]
MESRESKNSSDPLDVQGIKSAEAVQENRPAEKDDNAQLNVSSRGPVLFGLFLLLALFVGGGGWLYAANLAGAVIAQGTVVVEGKSKTVQHLDGGIVAEINVSDGDSVDQGDVLVRLDETLLEANLEIYRNRVLEAVARRSRLVSERDELEQIQWNEELLDILDMEQRESIRKGHQRLFQARRSAMRGQIDRLNEQVLQFESQSNGVIALKASKGRQIGLLSEELQAVSQLKEKGLATNAQVLGLERQRENLTGQIGEHDADLSRIANSINEAQIQVLQIEREARQTVLTELREVEQEINEVTQQLHATVEQLRRVEIKAPASGVIHELSVFTIGGVVGPGAPILQVIPQNQNFIIEANIEPQFIDELYPEQAAAIRFSAFNQRTTPELNGSVSGISANVVVDEQTGLPFYKVRLSVPPEELERLQGLQLIPGMPVEAFIKTRDRTALNYLVKPLLDQINRAFREE